MWVAARDPNSHDFAVANGCNVQVTALASGDAEVASLMERFNAACEAHPEVPRPQVMMLMHTYVADTEAELNAGAEDLQRFFAYFGKWARRERPIRQGFMEPLRDEDMAAASQYAPEKLRENLVIGTAEQVVHRIKHYEAMGYDQYSFWLDNHMDFERKRRSLQHFIDRVMPSFA
jgi:alkanesulfonate monooxygenase SsuD/methylene tetrahydromethanopterin reductase-like flavin-dependent oxidoreductase (luciferase family)